MNAGEPPYRLCPGYCRVARALDNSFLRDDVNLLVQYLIKRDPLEYRSRTWLTQRSMRRNHDNALLGRPANPHGVEDHRVGVLVFGHLLFDWLEAEAKAGHVVAKRAQRMLQKLSRANRDGGSRLLAIVLKYKKAIGEPVPTVSFGSSRGQTVESKIAAWETEQSFEQSPRSSRGGRLGVRVTAATARGKAKAKALVTPSSSSSRHGDEHHDEEAAESDGDDRDDERDGKQRDEQRVVVRHDHESPVHRRNRRRRARRAGTAATRADDAVARRVLQRVRWHLRQRMGTIRSLFRNFQVHDGGAVDEAVAPHALRAGIGRYLGFELSDDELAAMARRFDFDGDGRVDLREFMVAIETLPSGARAVEYRQPARGVDARSRTAAMVAAVRAAKRRARRRRRGWGSVHTGSDSDEDPPPPPPGSVGPGGEGEGDGAADIAGSSHRSATASASAASASARSPSAASASPTSGEASSPPQQPWIMVQGFPVASPPTSPPSPSPSSRVASPDVAAARGMSPESVGHGTYASPGDTADAESATARSRASSPSHASTLSEKEETLLTHTVGLLTAEGPDLGRDGTKWDVVRASIENKKVAFTALDRDGSGDVTLEEMIALCGGPKLSASAELRLRKLFALLDVDHSGSIDRHEIEVAFASSEEARDLGRQFGALRPFVKTATAKHVQDGSKWEVVKDYIKKKRAEKKAKGSLVDAVKTVIRAQTYKNLTEKTGPKFVGQRAKHIATVSRARRDLSHAPSHQALASLTEISNEDEGGTEKKLGSSSSHGKASDDKGGDEEDENTYLDLYYILDNPECKKVFSEYATSRNCGAKLLFLDEVEAFRDLPEGNYAKKKAQRIIDRFVKPGSARALEVGLSTEEQSAIMTAVMRHDTAADLSKLAKGGAEPPSHLGNDLFDEASFEVEDALEDEVLPNFLLDDSWREKMERAAGAPIAKDGVMTVQAAPTLLSSVSSAFGLTSAPSFKAQKKKKRRNKRDKERDRGQTLGGFLKQTFSFGRKKAKKVVTFGMGDIVEEAPDAAPDDKQPSGSERDESFGGAMKRVLSKPKFLKSLSKAGSFFGFSSSSKNEVTVEDIEAFYRKHNPAKVGNAPRIHKTYIAGKGSAGRKKLDDVLFEMYGHRLDSVIAKKKEDTEKDTEKTTGTGTKGGGSAATPITGEDASAAVSEQIDVMWSGSKATAAQQREAMTALQALVKAGPNPARANQAVEDGAVDAALAVVDEYPTETTLLCVTLVDTLARGQQQKAAVPPGAPPAAAPSAAGAVPGAVRAALDGLLPQKAVYALAARPDDGALAESAIALLLTLLDAVDVKTLGVDADGVAVLLKAVTAHGDTNAFVKDRGNYLTDLLQTGGVGLGAGGSRVAAAPTPLARNRMRGKRKSVCLPGARGRRLSHIVADFRQDPGRDRGRSRAGTGAQPLAPSMAPGRASRRKGARGRALSRKKERQRRGSKFVEKDGKTAVASPGAGGMGLKAGEEEEELVRILANPAPDKKSFTLQVEGILASPAIKGMFAAAAKAAAPPPPPPGPPPVGGSPRRRRRRSSFVAKDGKTAVPVPVPVPTPKPKPKPPPPPPPKPAVGMHALSRKARKLDRLQSQPLD